MTAVSVWSIACCKVVAEMELRTEEIMMAANGDCAFLKVQDEMITAKKSS